jgi:hypothetical protein
MTPCCVCSNNTHDSNAIRVQLARPNDSNAILEGGKEAEKARGRESGREGETAILKGGKEGMVIGYLPKPVACWLGPLADIGAIVMTARSVCCLCRGCGRDCQSVSTVCACAVRGLSCHSLHARSSSAVEECFSLSVSLTKYFSRNQVLARLGRTKLPSMGRIPVDA